MNVILNSICILLGLIIKSLMLAKVDRKQQMFQTLKAMFPHIDLSIVNQHLSFAQNLQNIISQLGTPRLSQTREQINNMKQAVDLQQLKIQKSLVNQQDILGNITNRTLQRTKNQKHTNNNKIIHSIEEQSSHYWHNEQNYFANIHKLGQNKHQDFMNDIGSDIWELGNQNSKDWFQH